MFTTEGKGMTVIADDLTGAAEIAGMAPAGTVVIATNTRSLSETEAQEETVRVIRHYALTKEHIIFKKTDSAIRGHIVAELQTIMRELGYERCLLLPQNPSKGRVIKDGMYYVNDVPLHNTSFSYDPEFPAVSSEVQEVLKGASYLSLNDRMKTGINIAEAKSKEDIELQVGKVERDTLVAGAADLFAAIRSQRSTDNPITVKPQNRITVQPHNRTTAKGQLSFDGFSSITIVQGSTLSQDLSTLSFFSQYNIQTCPMPDDVFDGADRTDWLKKGNICMTIPQKRSNPVWCKTIMAKTVCERFGIIPSEKSLTSIEIIHTTETDVSDADSLLVIEGGATAFAILTAMNWDKLQLIEQIAAGVVALKHDNVIVVLKPGSYPWGGMFSNFKL